MKKCLFSILLFSLNAFAAKKMEKANTRIVASEPKTYDVAFKDQSHKQDVFKEKAIFTVEKGRVGFDGSIYADVEASNRSSFGWVILPVGTTFLVKSITLGQSQKTETGKNTFEEKTQYEVILEPIEKHIESADSSDTFNIKMTCEYVVLWKKLFSNENIVNGHHSTPEDQKVLCPIEFTAYPAHYGPYFSNFRDYSKFQRRGK